MTISSVALTNTFDQWRIITNQIVTLVNNLTDGSSNANNFTANTITVQKWLTVGGINVEPTLVSVFGQANTTKYVANLAFDAANAAFLQANTDLLIANLAFDKANGANMAHLTANAAFDKANTANVMGFHGYAHANAAFDKANTANMAHLTANAAFDKANTANVMGFHGYAQANTANTRAYNSVLKSGDVMTGRLFISSGGANGAVSILTDSANVVTPDLSLNCNFTLALTNNFTLANATNLSIGQSGVIRVTQNTTTPKTLAVGLIYRFAGNVAPTITATANAVDMIVYYVATANSIICDIKQSVGTLND